MATGEWSPGQHHCHQNRVCQRHTERGRLCLAVDHPAPGADSHGGAGDSAGGHRGDGEMLPEQAVKETGHKEGGEDGDEKQKQERFLLIGLNSLIDQ